MRVVFKRLMKGNPFLISLHRLIKSLLNLLVLGQEKSRQRRRRTNRYYIRGVNVVPCVPEASWDHISLKQLCKELLHNNITPYMKNYFWWKSVIFNRMVGQYFAIVKQESFSMLSFLQDGLGVEEGQRLIGCGGKGSVSVAITRYTSTCEVLRRTLGTPITSHTAGPETPN